MCWLGWYLGNIFVIPLLVLLYWLSYLKRLCLRQRNRDPEFVNWVCHDDFNCDDPQGISADRISPITSFSSGLRMRHSLLDCASFRLVCTVSASGCWIEITSVSNDYFFALQHVSWLLVLLLSDNWICEDNEYVHIHSCLLFSKWS